MRIDSIRSKLLFTLVAVVVISISIVGILGILYYQNVLKNTIWENNLAQAKALASFSDSYLGSSVTFLESIADRPLLKRSVEERSAPMANEHLIYIVNKSDFKNCLITDISGIVFDSYPNQSLIGNDYSTNKAIQNTLNSNSTSINVIKSGNVNGEPAICISVPIISNGSMIGTMTGEIDTDTYASYILNSQLVNRQFIHVVNRTGHLIVYSNTSWMNDMRDFSDLPSTQKVLAGETGVIEQYNPYENQVRLASFTPINKTGWGLTVAVPIDIAYASINQATNIFIMFIVIMALISGLIAYLLGNNLVKPLTQITGATKEMAIAGAYHKKLPVNRRDEIGDLARSFDIMANRILEDRELITDEKNRAELYLDVMGHDINNLNQSAMFNLELIQEDSNLTEEQRESINNALISTRGSANLIDNVRKLQKINEEKLELEPVDINDVILAGIEGAPKPTNKKVVINYTPRKGLVVKGTALLKEIFCNLIGNSIKYSGDNVTIDITVNEILIESKKFYSVAVADNGYGIPDELKPKLFYRFQRGTTKAHGKGLGLYIVKSLLERISGSVEIEDRVKGDYTRGSKFIVKLPVCEECK